MAYALFHPFSLAHGLERVPELEFVVRRLPAGLPPPLAPAEGQPGCAANPAAIFAEWFALPRLGFAAGLQALDLSDLARAAALFEREEALLAPLILDAAGFD